MKKRVPEDIALYRSHYSEKGFLRKIRRFASRAGAAVIHVALILYYELQDREVSLKDKALILGGLGYFILPTDLIPDFIPFFGYTDDLTALLSVIDRIRMNITPSVERRAMEHVLRLFPKLSPDDLKLRLRH